MRLRSVLDPKVAALITRKPTGHSVLAEKKAKARINGQPIARRTDQRDGDVIEVGTLKLLFFP